VGANGTLGTGDVDVVSGTLYISAGDTIADRAHLASTGRIFLASGVYEVVGGLSLDGVEQPIGTYGSSTSAAANRYDQYFSGPGVLSVIPEPGGFAAVGLFASLFRPRRRSRKT
jgi:hypothetical protein